MGWFYWLKCVGKKVLPAAFMELYRLEIGKTIKKARFFTDLYRLVDKAVYGTEQPAANSELSVLEKRYDKVVVCWLPTWIIGHFCTVYHFAYQAHLKEKNERVRYVIVPDTFKSAVGQGVPNQYLYTKFTEKMPAAIRPATAWRAYIEKHFQKGVLLGTYETDTFYLEATKKYFSGTENRLAIPFDCPSVEFSSEERTVGQKAMTDLGIGEKYICIFARDAAYHGEGEEDTNQVRNFDIAAFQDTAAYFWEQYNMQSVRMGAKVNKAFSCKGAVDYASMGRSEFLDAFLFSQCAFYVGNSSGIDCIARLFAKPIVAVDFPCVLPIDEPTMPYHLLIYVKWYDEERQRYLSLREIVRLQIKLKMQKPMGHGSDAFFVYVEQQNITVVHNTPKEILDVAKEMYAVLQGTMYYTEEDELLHRRYRAIIHEETKTFRKITGNFGRVGTQWLRENTWFLE